MEPVVSIKGVSKLYRFFPSKQDQLKRILSFGRAKVGREFWALRDVNLEVEPGTTLGIIGRNGAGKTTLLRIISGILQPTSGTVRVSGRLVALFALGAGFDDEFTGRENVMMNGLVLGIDRKEMLERFDEIEAFADIGEFMYQPVKTYSSGMRARLGFAVAVTVEPDILVVDEALATGDAAFKAKGMQKMHELRDSGATILFVSHSTSQVSNFCTEAALLHKGTLLARGDTDEVIAEYHDLIANAKAQRKNRRDVEGASDLEAAQENGPGQPDGEPHNASRHGTGDARVENVEVLDDRGRPVDAVAPEEDLTVRVHARYAKAVEDSVIDIALRDETGLDVFSTNTALEKAPVGGRSTDERVVVDFTFPVPLRHGRYSVSAGILRPGGEEKDAHLLDRGDAAAVFRVTRPLGGGTVPGLVRLPTRIMVFEPDKVREHYPSG